MPPKQILPRNPWRTVAIFACVIAASTLAVAGVAVALNYNRTDEIGALVKQLVQDRADGRELSCNQLNTLIDPLNDIIVKLAAPRTGTTRSPADQAKVNASVRAILLQRRVCTAPGIAAFYAHDLAHAYETPPQAKQLIGVTP